MWFFPQFLMPPREWISELTQVKTPGKTETRLFLTWIYSLTRLLCCSTNRATEGVVQAEMSLDWAAGKQETFQTVLSLKPMFHGTQLVMRQLLRSGILLAAKISFFFFLFFDEVLKWVAATLLTLQRAQVTHACSYHAAKPGASPLKQ